MRTANRTTIPTTAYIISSYLTKAGPINLVEDASIIMPSKAYKGSNTLLKLTPL